MACDGCNQEKGTGVQEFIDYLRRREAGDSKGRKIANVGTGLNITAIYGERACRFMNLCSKISVTANNGWLSQ